MSETRRKTLRVATYNIHRCRGLDGRTNPARIADVIRAVDADVVALQEVVGAGPNSAGHAEELGALLGMGWVMAPVRHLRGSLFGNVVLSRFPIRHHLQHDLPGRPASRAAASASTSRSATTRCISTTSTWAPRSSSGTIRPSG